MMEQRNLIAAILLSVAIVLGFQFLVQKPRIEQQQAAHQQAISQNAPSLATPQAPSTPSAPTPQATNAPSASAPLDRAEILRESPRVMIDTPRVQGSIALRGARFDDLTLVQYRETIDPNSPHITLLTPAGMPDAYFADAGWTAAAGVGIKMPDKDTMWQADRMTLTPSTPVTLTWDNGQGLRFVTTYSVDDAYMISIDKRVENSSAAAVTLFPYARVSRNGNPPESSYYILFEGPLGVFNKTLKEIKYKELQKEPVNVTTTGGWLGFTDKYWLVAVVPDQNMPVSAHFSDDAKSGQNAYQAYFVSTAGLTAAPGESVESRSMIFAGAKEVKLLNAYQDNLGIERLSYAIDWGWFFFLTKPIFLLLDWLYKHVGNFGIAILLLTVIIKGLFFPLANKSYRAMSKLKKLQPEMMKIRERFGDDRERMNKEMMELYKREKANPTAGCLPIFIQIPVFFSLYKVLFVTIEMRHAPFYGWIRDLSAPDPTSVLNLFGLLPAWTLPDSLSILPVAILAIGVWPIIMGVTMFLQQKLNPAPADPVQAKMFMILPVVFTFMLAKFPAGLVIYWTWNNLLSIAQQWVIMRRAGVKP
ncbi:MAG TPA: membrane protein insertase YidC [Alphaproteobacteria bacterium]|nr:membrane protein insertase YidC [Alphaproteobacteria bacterium]